MPARKTSSSGGFARNVAPLAPLALALVMTAVLPSGRQNITQADLGTETEAAVCPDDITDFQDCHSRFPTGCSAKAGYDPYLNLLKNQLTPPPAASFKPPQVFDKLEQFESLDQNMPQGLTSRNHAQFRDDLAKLGEGKLFAAVGYLYYAQVTGAESSNCGLDSKGDPEGSNVDFHIGIGFDPGLAGKVAGSSAKPTGTLMKDLQQNSIIVEMTPQYRFSFEEGIWTIENLRKALGKPVRVTGQLIVDSEHNLPGQNCSLASTAKEKQSCWRASTWELHPVVQFQVCKSASCDASSSTSDWANLGQSGTGGISTAASGNASGSPSPNKKKKRASSGSNTGD